MRWWVFAAVASLSVAGCTGSETPDSAQGAQAGSKVDANAGSGSIAGTVTDSELTPIAGVEVLIQHRSNSTGPELRMRTDGGGRFLAQGLFAGPYLVFAGALGYQKHQAVVVNVLEGEVAEVTIALERIAIPVAHVETVSFSTYYYFYLCPLVAGVPFCTGLYAAANTTYDHDVEEDVTGTLETIVYEAIWQNPVSVCSTGERTVARGPDYDEKPDPNSWSNIGGQMQSPTHLYVPRSGDHPNSMSSSARVEQNGGKAIKTDGPWQFYTYPYATPSLGTPVDFTCLWDRTTEVWVSFFFLEAAPSETWSVFAS